MNASLESTPGWAAVWRNAALLVILSAAIVAIFSASDYGISWDYEAHDTYGRQVFEWYQAPSWDHIAVQQGMKYYGPAFEILVNLARRILPADQAYVKALVTHLVGLAGVLGCYVSASTIAGARAGFFAALLLLITPMYYGHSFINHKDLPFAAAYSLALAFIISAAGGNRRWMHNILTALALGFALAIRIGAIFLIPALALGWCTVPLLSRGTAQSKLKAVVSAGLAVILVLLLAWGLMLLLWPFALLHPISAPLEVIRKSSAYPWQFPVLYGGQSILAKDAPLSYTFAWFRITLPEVFLFALACGLVVLIKSALLRFRGASWRRALLVATVTLSWLLPLLSVLILKSTIYDAVRHLLFIVPPLAVLGGLALDTVYRTLESVARKVYLICLAILALFVVADLRSLHPYQYVYFNRLYGGLPAAYGQFETEYWATCMKESLEWIEHNIPAGANSLRIAAWCEPLQINWYLDQMRKARPDLEFSGEARADLYIVTSRFGAHLNRRENLVHTIGRQGVPLCFIFDRTKLAETEKR